MKNLFELKEQFFINNFPLWKLYRGTRKTNAELISSNTEEFRMIESWDKLEKVINLNKSTIYNFVIYQTDNVKNTTGGYTLYLDIKEAPAPPPAVPTIGAAIDNTQVYQITQEFNKTIQDLKEQIKEQQYKQEKQELINEFNLKFQELETATDTKKQGIEMLKLFALNLMKPKAAAAIGAATMENPEEQEEPEHETPINYNIDFNSIFESVAIIKNYIPDVEIFLFRLSEMLENASDTERQNLINILKMYLNV